MASNRVRTGSAFAAGLAALLAAGAPFCAVAGQGAQGDSRTASARTSSPAVAAGEVAGDSSALAARNLPLGAPSLRIYRSVGADGSVGYADRAAPGAKIVQIRTYVSASDTQAVATAQRQQQYWREQADAFARRLQERDEAEERERRAREISSSPFLFLVSR